MKNLLIIGAGQYGYAAKEIAESMQCFGKIDFLDDFNEKAIGKTDEYNKFYPEYSCIIAAIGNPSVRKNLFDRLINTDFELVNLIHPTASISSSAVIKKGCIIEPNAVVYTAAVIEDGCFISCGAVVNHNCSVGEFSHIDCNAAVMKASSVPKMTNVEANTNWISKE